MAGAYRLALAATIAAICLGVAAPLRAADDGARICVLVPHFKDEYWLGVGYGLENEAQRHALDVMFFEAGGYRGLQRQTRQVGNCLSQGADAILIGVVSADDPGLTRAIARASRQVPVLGLVNETRAPDLSGFVGVDWREMGQALGAYLAARHPPGSAAARALLVTGPAEAGWTGPLESGLRAGLARGAVQIVDILHADTGLRQQLEQVETGLARHPEAEYLIGSAPAIEAAMGLGATGSVPDMPGLLATYISYSVLRGLADGDVLAAPFDDPIAQGRMAIHQIAEVLKTGQPAGQTGPDIVLLESPLNGGDLHKLAPADYFPDIE